MAVDDGAVLPVVDVEALAIGVAGVRLGPVRLVVLDHDAVGVPGPDGRVRRVRLRDVVDDVVRGRTLPAESPKTRPHATHNVASSEPSADSSSKILERSDQSTGTKPQDPPQAI